MVSCRWGKAVERLRGYRGAPAGGEDLATGLDSLLAAIFLYATHAYRSGPIRP